jgi:hypothetical protein
MKRQQTSALFIWLIRHQPTVLFSQNKPATSRNQTTILFFQNKSTPATNQTNKLQMDPTTQVLKAAKECTVLLTRISSLLRIVLGCRKWHKAC